jgi:hypothetical protein
VCAKKQTANTSFPSSINIITAITTSFPQVGFHVVLQSLYIPSENVILTEMATAKQSNNCSADHLSQIDRWEKETINKVRQSAERARQQLTKLFNSGRETLTEQLETLANDIHRRRQDDHFAEDEIEQLRRQIDRLQLSLRQVTRTDEVTIVKNGNINWNRLIYAETRQERGE